MQYILEIAFTICSKKQLGQMEKKFVFHSAYMQFVIKYHDLLNSIK